MVLYMYKKNEELLKENYSDLGGNREDYIKRLQLFTCSLDAAENIIKLNFTVYT